MNQNRTTLQISVANRRGAPATRFTIDSRGRIHYVKAPAAAHAKSEALATPHDGHNAELVNS